MHPTEPRVSFLVLRASGWSLRKISAKINVPCSTLCRWHGEQRRHLDYLKSLHAEKPRGARDSDNSDLSAIALATVDLSAKALATVDLSAKALATVDLSAKALA